MTHYFLHLKTDEGESLPRVRIPAPPPFNVLKVLILLYKLIL